MDVSVASDETTQWIAVRLSRRNLKTLLAKLDGSPADSACTIRRAVGDSVWPTYVLTVIAEEDADHYGDRSPGETHPDTERAIGGKG